MTQITLQITCKHNVILNRLDWTAVQLFLYHKKHKIGLNM